MVARLPPMLVKAAIVWVVGLVMFVPYAAWYLLFHASRDQYALLITFVFFWPFGYWGVVGPLIMAVKVRRVFRTIEAAGSSEALRSALTSPESREVAIDLIASENHIPRFVASRVYHLLVRHMPRDSQAWDRLWRRGR
jgi:hypothetical protein